MFLECRIGTSGFSYNHWRGVFYPEGLPPARWLEHYQRYFDTVELNNTFYRLPKAETFQGWRRNTPPGFLFAVKASRYLTHLKRLKDAAEPLELFLKRAEGLGERLGPVLFQLPPRWPADVARLREFLELLPGGLKAAFEFRDVSWFKPEVFALLEVKGVAFCIYSLPGVNCPQVVTAPFVYLRLHGSSSRYGSKYTEEELQYWGRRIQDFLAQGLGVYAYFNNDAFGYAVANALRLKAILGTD